jgi:hypothetical protein
MQASALHAGTSRTPHAFASDGDGTCVATCCAGKKSTHLRFSLTIGKSTLEVAARPIQPNNPKSTDLLAAHPTSSDNF